jgi:hypothetical protein
MAALLIAEEEDQKQAPPSRQGNSSKARKQRNQRKAKESEGLVGSAVVESSGHVQDQQQSRVEPPPSATLPLAIDSAENENTCIVCLAAPRSSLLLPCNHQVMWAECVRNGGFVCEQSAAVPCV